MLQLLNSKKKRLVEGRRIMNDDGTPTPYVITEEGEVWSDEINNFRKIMISKDTGRPIIGLSLNGEYKYYSVHRFVAKAFLSNEYNYPCVNHKDSDPTNNNWRNLEWCTYEYNSEYGAKHGYSNPKYHRDKSILNVDQIKEICKLIDDGWKSIDIANKFGVNKNYIANIKIGSTHRDISAKYKFSEHWKQNDKYKDFAMVGNEGNHYIPPLPDEDEPVYVKTYDEVNIRKLCEMLSGPNHISTRMIAPHFNMDPIKVNKIRNGELFPEITKEYKINNDKRTAIRINFSKRPDLVEEIFKLASNGDNTITSIGAKLILSPGSVKNVLENPIFSDYKNRYPINLKENHKGTPLTDEQKMKILKLLSANQYTREEISSIMNLSLSSIVKIKKNAKKAGLL